MSTLVLELKGLPKGQVPDSSYYQQGRWFVVIFQGTFKGFVFVPDLQNSQKAPALLHRLEPFMDWSGGPLYGPSTVGPQNMHFIAEIARHIEAIDKGK